MLSSRLEKISSLVDNSSEYLWDLCCDHGKFGENYIGKIKSVYFVDVVSDIVDSLKSRLSRKNFLPQDYECITCDASKVQIKNLEQETIVIAGVGGHTCIKIISSMLKRNLDLKPEFIISPQKNLDKVLDFLYKNGFSIISHDIIMDRNVKYDILKTRKES